MNLVVVTIIVLVVLVAIPVIMRRRTWNNLNQEIMDENFDAFYYTLDTLRAQMSMSAFERENMRLSGYIAQDRKDDIENQLNMMMNMRIKNAEKTGLYERAFYYYLQQGRAKKTRDMLEMVKAMDEDRAKDLEIQYSILIKKESRYIDEIQGRIERLWDGKSLMDAQKQMAVGTLEYLLGLQYAYKNDIENMKRVFDRALEHVQGTPYEESIKEVLKEKA